MYELAESTQDWGYDQKGTLKRWQENVGKYCAGNHILTLAVLIALSGPLLKFFPNIGSTIFHLAGETSKGKTTALQIAASIWGHLKQFLMQWRFTDNALEGILTLHNDGFLALDELSQLAVKKFGPVIYMISNGRSKGRFSKDSELKEIKSWRLNILSSGESGLEDTLNETGDKVKGGMEVRFIEIDTLISDEIGIFNTLHDFEPTDSSKRREQAAKFANHLKDVAAKYPSVVAYEFMSRLVALISETPGFADSLYKLYKVALDGLVSKFKLADADSQVLRVAESFAVLKVAGTMAIRLKVLPETFEIEESISFNFARWLSGRGGKKNVEGEEIVQHVRDYLIQYQDRFKKITKNTDDGKLAVYPGQSVIQNSLGYVNVCKEQTVYYVIPKVFRDEICKYYSVKSVRNALHKKGMLQEKDGANARVRIDGMQNRYVILPVNHEAVEQNSTKNDTN